MVLKVAVSVCNPPSIITYFPLHISLETAIGAALLRHITAVNREDGRLSGVEELSCSRIVVHDMGDHSHRV